MPPRWLAPSRPCPRSAVRRRDPVQSGPMRRKRLLRPERREMKAATMVCPSCHSSCRPSRRRRAVRGRDSAQPGTTRLERLPRDDGPGDLLLRVEPGRHQAGQSTRGTERLPLRSHSPVEASWIHVRSERCQDRDHQFVRALLLRKVQGNVEPLKALAGCPQDIGSQKAPMKGSMVVVACCFCASSSWA